MSSFGSVNPGFNPKTKFYYENGRGFFLNLQEETHIF
jgi:hypothetical protein